MDLYEPYRKGATPQVRAPRREPLGLAAIDIDDTLLGPDGEIGAANALAVGALRARGFRVVLASGRSHANMLRFHRALRLGGGPVISAQGALVRGATDGAIWLAQEAPAEAVLAATRAGIERGFSVLHYAAERVRIQARTPWTERHQARNDDPHLLVPDLAAEGGHGVFKVLWLGDPARVEGAEAEARERFAGALSVTATDPGHLEFGHPEVSKATALAAVARRLGIARERVLAFGDGNNDVPMLAWAGLGVAMSHARPAAREAADLVAPAGDPETSLARAVQAALARAPRRAPHRSPAMLVGADPGGGGSS